MDTKKLRQKILDLAIRGKLVPQNPNDEPAIELLKRINPKFEPCETGFVTTQLPDNWCWVRGIDIFEPMKSTRPQGDTFKYIDIDAIDNKRNIITSVKVLNSREAPSRASRYTEKGNVLFSMVRPYLRNISMVPEDDCIASTGFYVCGEKECLDSRFCLYLMLSDYVVSGLNEFMKGDNSPSINKSHIDSYAFPLPPLSEQKRIVTAIEQWFALIDILENEKNDLQASIQQAKSKILDLAIHGKLVPQDPNDEPAIELLKRINPKYKPCDEEDCPYEVPEGWTFCHLQDVFKITMGSSPVGESLNRIGEGIEFHQGKLCFSEMFLGISDVYSTEPIKKANPFSLLLCVRAPVGIVNICNREICIGRGLCALTPLQGLDLKYGFYTLQTCQQDFEQKATGSTFKAIGGDVVKNQIILLPPHQEQLRIVTKIEELFAVLDDIKESLE